MDVISVLRIARERGSSPLVLVVRDGVRYGAVEFSHDLEHPLNVASASDVRTVAKAVVLRHAAERIETEWVAFWYRADLVRVSHTYCLTYCDIPQAYRLAQGKVWAPPAVVSTDANLSAWARAYLIFCERFKVLRWM